MTHRRRIPKYRLHKPSGQAVVTLSGRDIYLGPHGSRTSRDIYDRAIAEWLANGRQLVDDAPERPSLTVSEVLLRFWEHAQGYYRKGLEKDPSDLTLLNNLALSLMLDRQYAEAISTLSRVTADPRSTVRHRQNLAMVYGVAGRKDDARRPGTFAVAATTEADWCDVIRRPK